jgi:hypothetical protein
MLTRQGYELRVADADPQLVASYKAQLTVAPVLPAAAAPRNVRRFRVYGLVDSETTMIVPRFFVVTKTTQRLWERVSRIAAKFEGSLRDDLDQPRAVDAVLRSLETVGGAVLSLKAGGGKTTCACFVAASLGVKTLVVVHKDVLRAQWAERVRQFLPGAAVSFVRGETCDTSGDVVIAMLQTLVSRRYAPDVFAACGLVCVDECHHIGAEVFSSAMRGLCAPYMLGLSATPVRKDGLSKVIHWYLGPLVFQSERRNMGHVKVEVLRYDAGEYMRGPPPTNRFGNVCFTSVVTHLVKDAARVDVIAARVRRELDADPTRKVLVLSHRRAHCIALAKAVGESSCDVLIGGVTAAKKGNAGKRCVCATYAFVSEGYDDPTLNALVLATPCSDVVQAVGRILRGSGGARPRIIDVLDCWATCYAQLAKRKKYYASAGFDVIGSSKKKQEYMFAPDV